MKLIYSILLLFTFTTTLAQENKKLIGFESAIGISELRGNPLFENQTTFKKVFNTGVSFQYNLNNTLSLSSSLYFQNKGTIIPDVLIEDINGTTIGQLRVNENFNFINLPILLRLNYGSKLKLVVDVGPYSGILISQVEKTEGGEKFERKNTDRFKRIEFGLYTGLGLMLDAGNRFFITLKVNNEFGLNDLAVNSNYYNLPINTARFKDVQIYKSGVVKTNTLFLKIGLLRSFK